MSKVHLRLDPQTGDLTSRLSDESLEAICANIRELLLSSATPEQLTAGMRRLMACVLHGNGETCPLCQDDPNPEKEEE